MNPNNTRYGIAICDRCAACSWRNDSFFCQFDADILTAFDAITYTNVYPGGSLLYAEGEAPRGLFILCNGAAKLSISSGSGKTLITRIVGAGEVLGLSSVLSGNAYKSSAETTAPSQLKFVKREDFLRFSETYREVSRKNLLESYHDAISYRDVRLLQGFVAERGKIVPRRLTGVCTRHQRRLSLAIKQSRNIALLAFAARF